ncbi:MAG: hypothetical protein L6Q71_02395 [Planctomycetes bacterium]|nr:hypothetical protein [Planctomycetota bacterium]
MSLMTEAAPTIRIWTDPELNDLVRCWQNCTLPFEQWAPHTSHMATTVWHLRNYPFEEAERRMREGIPRYNHAHGKFTGYHETVTRFYIRIVRDAIKRLDKTQSTAELANAVIASLGASREDRLKLMREYYSFADTMFTSDEARKSWIEPDLKRLD